MPTIDICKIQEAQLAAARNKLVESVGSIIENLRDIYLNITDISQNTQELSNSDTAGGPSFLAEMDGHLAEVSSSLRHYGSAGHDLAALIGSLAPAIGDMASCLRDIEGIEIAIERIALNACIKAAHLRGEGAALGVLAEGIQSLVADTRRQTVNLSQKLESISATAQELNLDGGGAQDEPDLEVSLLINEIGTILDSLQALDEKAYSDLTEVQEKGNLLSKDLQRICQEINVHERVVETINQVLSELNQLSRQCESQNIVEELQKMGPIEVETLKNNYTMKDERLVHVAVADSSSILEAESGLKRIQEDHGLIKESEKDKEHDLGDNVELF